METTALKPSPKILARQGLNERYDLVHVGQIEAKQPAFLSLTESPDGSPVLYVSGFSVLGGGRVSAVQSVSCQRRLRKSTLWKVLETFISAPATSIKTASRK